MTAIDSARRTGVESGGSPRSGALGGVVTHVPTGLGVLEAVFLSAFAGRLDDGTLLATLLACRATCYPLPLAAAA